MAILVGVRAIQQHVPLVLDPYSDLARPWSMVLHYQARPQVFAHLPTNVTYAIAGGVVGTEIHVGVATANVSHGLVVDSGLHKHIRVVVGSYPVSGNVVAA
jgi:hypothetical protein